MPPIEQSLPARLKIEWHGETLHLLAEHALWWPGNDTLLVADLHLGKPASFRASGIPIPEGCDEDDLQRLSRILTETGAGRLLVLGDLIHNQHSLTDQLTHHFGEWRDRHPKLRLDLAIGNHDRPVTRVHPQLGIDTCQEEFQEPPFCFRHFPEPQGHEEGHVVAGHTHPRVRLSDGQSRGLSLPCFHFGQKATTLPAFGSFTGTHRIQPAANDRVVVVAEGSLMEVPTALC